MNNRSGTTHRAQLLESSRKRGSNKTFNHLCKFVKFVSKASVHDRAIYELVSSQLLLVNRKSEIVIRKSKYLSFTLLLLFSNDIII